ncbi:MAG: cadherin repeat domain-containing protein [Verrucomicrobiae bacterium]|nr:cadherin repeat domain-containing protein [Verrucomicrobiae bacterium]
MLSYSLVSGPSGLTVGAGAGELYGRRPSTGARGVQVTVQVRDNGEPPLGDMKGFRITVREVNTAPVLSAVADQAIDEQVPWSVQLTASDADLPAQVLSYSLVSGPSGLTVGAGGLVSWTPTGTQGPGEYEVAVRVSDSGVPPLSDSRTFRVTVHDAPPPPPPPPPPPEPVVRRVWQLGVDDDPAVLPYQPTREFSVQSGLKESPPGVVTRLPGDPEY